MILHYANLCVVAGGVDLFLLGSEFRGLETIRGPAWTKAGTTGGDGKVTWDYPFVAGADAACRRRTRACSTALGYKGYREPAQSGRPIRPTGRDGWAISTRAKTANGRISISCTDTTRSIWSASTIICRCRTGRRVMAGSTRGIGWSRRWWGMAAVSADVQRPRLLVSRRSTVRYLKAIEGASISTGS